MAVIQKVLGNFQGSPAQFGVWNSSDDSQIFGGSYPSPSRANAGVGLLVSADGTKFVAAFQDNYLRFGNVSDGSSNADVSLGSFGSNNIDSLCWHPDYTKVWAAMDAGYLIEVDATSHAVTSHTIGGEPQFALAHPAGRYVYVGNYVDGHGSDTLRTFDTNSNSIVNTIRLPNEPLAAVIVGTKLFDACYTNGGSIYSIDISTPTSPVATAIPSTAAGWRGIGANSDKSKIYATGNNTIFEIDPVTNAILRSSGTGWTPQYSAQGVATNADNSQLYTITPFGILVWNISDLSQVTYLYPNGGSNVCTAVAVYNAPAPPSSSGLLLQYLGE